MLFCIEVISMKKLSILKAKKILKFSAYIYMKFFKPLLGDNVTVLLFLNATLMQLHAINQPLCCFKLT